VRGAFLNRASGIPANSSPGRCQSAGMQGSSEAMNGSSQTSDFTIALSVSTS
jgi:hypothetical protein